MRREKRKMCMYVWREGKAMEVVQKRGRNERVKQRRKAGRKKHNLREDDGRAKISKRKGACVPYVWRDGEAMEDKKTALRG